MVGGEGASPDAQYKAPQMVMISAVQTTEFLWRVAEARGLSRESVVEGKGVGYRVRSGGLRINKKKKRQTIRYL